MPESDQPRSSDRSAAMGVTAGPPVDKKSWLGLLPGHEHDLDVLSWLQCSPQLGDDVKGLLVDALLGWALIGRGYPQMSLPEAGWDCDHVQVLQQIIARFPARVTRVDTVGDKLELGRVRRLLAQAARTAANHEGVRNAVAREAGLAAHRLDGPPTTDDVPDRWRS